MRIVIAMIEVDDDKAIAEDLGTSWCRPGLKRSPDEIKEFLKSFS